MESLVNRQVWQEPLLKLPVTCSTGFPGPTKTACKMMQEDIHQNALKQVDQFDVLHTVFGPVRLLYYLTDRPVVRTFRL